MDVGRLKSGYKGGWMQVVGGVECWLMITGGGTMEVNRAGACCMVTTNKTDPERKQPAIIQALLCLVQ
jgi:hypothetical protein